MTGLQTLDLAIPLAVAESRIKLLEALIWKYANQVGCCEGVTYLETRYSGSVGGDDDFTHEEWDEIRRIAKVTH